MNMNVINMIKQNKWHCSPKKHKNITEWFNTSKQTCKQFPKGYTLYRTRANGLYFWQKGIRQSPPCENFWEIYHQAKWDKHNERANFLA